MSDIKGYKVLSPEDLTNINKMKDLEKTVLLELKALFEQDNIDRRWVAIARTNIEQAFMAACRAIAKPDTVEFGH